MSVFVNDNSVLFKHAKFYTYPSLRMKLKKVVKLETIWYDTFIESCETYREVVKWEMWKKKPLHGHHASSIMSRNGVILRTIIKKFPQDTANNGCHPINILTYVSRCRHFQLVSSILLSNDRALFISTTLRLLLLNFHNILKLIITHRTDHSDSLIL